ncbi:MAG: DUF6504 family protein [Propionibacteriaceae bacterium]|jgi:hypothetical protein|nr:DUF6504 family protein [Propionibacteriaceae bacterium]
METGDLVAVWATETGVPQKFEWRGHSYVVCGHPVPWVDRLPWWSLGQEGPLNALEQQMWRVSGVNPDTGHVTCVDLAVEEPSWWRLASIHE